jgi:hypothetical protein
MLLRNVGTCLQVQTTLQPRRPTSTVTCDVCECFLLQTVSNRTGSTAANFQNTDRCLDNIDRCTGSCFRLRSRAAE